MRSPAVLVTSPGSGLVAGLIGAAARAVRGRRDVTSA